MGLVNAWQCAHHAIKSGNNAISQRLQFSLCRREFAEPLDCTQAFPSHSNNHQLLRLDLQQLCKTPLQHKVQRSRNGGLCTFKALTLEQSMRPLFLLSLQESALKLQKLNNFDLSFLERYICGLMSQ